MPKPSKAEVVLASLLGLGPVIGVFLGGALVAASRTWPHELGFDLLLGVSLALGMFVGVVPSSLAALSVALRWGWLGFVPYALTMTLCATGFFLLVRRFAADSVRERVERHPKLAPFANALDKRAFALLLAIRLSPVLVYSWTNALFAVSRLSLRQFIVGTALGGLPRIAAGFAAGRAGLSIFQELREGTAPGWTAWLMLLVAVALLAMFGMIGRAWIESLRAGDGNRPSS
ncbi:MAG: hypothetical protein RL173_334 [Fibrobacterota bacterium]|jgi:uncharacterized membrane protein YdjX (TVP38/TMEM64 family)